jgi:hypothetical protein
MGTPGMRYSLKLPRTPALHQRRSHRVRGGPPLFVGTPTCRRPNVGGRRDRVRSRGLRPGPIDLAGRGCR